jgi:transcriptional regulator with XRE-family HTH domain
LQENHNLLRSSDQEQFYKRLGELIKDARKQAKVKQENLARYLGLNRVSVVNIEKGRQKPQIHTLVEISIYLNIPLERILEPLSSSLNNNFDKELEERITKEGVNKVEDIRRIKEFYKFTHAKKNQ